MATFEMPAALLPSDIAALGEWLKARHMRVHPAQLIAAARLLNSQCKPPPVKDLASWLGPVFCTNSIEQEAFARHYAAWLVFRGWTAPPQEDDTSGGEGGEQNVRAGLRFSFWATVLLALLLVCAALTWIWHAHDTAVVVRSATGQVLNDADVATTSPSVQVSKNLDGQTVLHYRRAQLPLQVNVSHPLYLGRDGKVFTASAELRAPEDRLEITLKHEPPPPSEPSQSLIGRRIAVVPAPPALRMPGRQAAPQISIDYAALSGALALPLVSLVWWLFTQARRRGFLERMPGGDSANTKLFTAGSRPALTSYAQDLRFLGREMRRRRTTAARVLDVSATLSETLRQAGLPSLRYGSRSEPEYLMLVDRTSSADHLAHLADEVIHSFHAQGVYIDRYVFDGDPRYCRHVPFERAALYLGPQSLELLFSRHPGARLVIFSDGGELIDRFTGKPAAWIKSLLEWHSPVMVTPQPSGLWSLREWMLAQAGLTILPFDGNGFHMMGELLRHERSRPGIVQNGRAGGRRAYLRDTDLLFERHPLSPAHMAAVMSDLLSDLKPDGIEWLAACAVYPEIHWSITLAVGDALFEGRNFRFTQLLAQLSRLPWMRVGYMPDWLRTHLVHRLAPHTERTIRIKLDAFLCGLQESQNAQTSTTQLPVSNTRARSALADGLRGAYAWLSRRSKPGDIRDAIFLQFMSGPRNRLSVRASDALVRLFYKNGAPLAGAHFWPVLATVPIAVFMSASMGAIQQYVPPALGVYGYPVPAMIAFDRLDSSVGIYRDEGSIQVRSVDKLASGNVDFACQLDSSKMLHMMLQSGASVTFLATDGTRIVLNEISDGGCGSSAQTKVVKAVLIDAGRLITEPVAADDAVWQDPYCVLAGFDSFTVIGREFLNQSLLGGRTSATACAIGQYGLELLVATEDGALVTAHLANGRISQQRSAALAPSTHAISLAVSARGDSAAALLPDGSVVVRGLGMDPWQSIGKLDGRGPIAISSNGETVAFSNGRREVEFWHVTPTPAPSPTPARPPAPKPATDRQGTTTAQTGAPPPTVPLPIAPPAPAIPLSEKVTFAADVFFDFDKTTIAPEGLEKLDDVVAKSRTLNLEVIIVVGHSASEDEPALALRQSIARADAVKSYLVSKGIERNRIYAEGKGDRSPVSDNRTAEGRARNRRVEIEIIGTRRAESAPTTN